MDTSPRGAPSPALVTDDADLLDDLLRLCAAANVSPAVVSSTTDLRQAWARAETVLIGEDRAAGTAALGLPRRDHVILVSHRRERDSLWSLAVELRADAVVLLPAEQERVVTHLVDLADGANRAVTVGVLGGCGGAGASVTAAALALTASRGGRQALLVDADPLGGGIELVLGCEDHAGLRWPEVAATEGRVSAAAFRAALPLAGPLPVLSWDRTGARRASPAIVHAMVSAAQRGSELVVLDLPRARDEAATEALLLCDTVLLVTTSDVRGVAAASGALAGLATVCPDVRLVVRVVPNCDLRPREVADSLGLPLAGQVPTRRSVTRAVNDGLGPLTRGGLERVCRRLLSDVVWPPDAST